MMSLELLTVSTLFFGVCVGEDSYKKVCYGGTYRFPGRNTFQVYMGSLYLTPSNGEPKRLLVEKGQAKHPRISVDDMGFSLNDVVNEDEGYFSIQTDGQKLSRIATIKVSDCAIEIQKKYGEDYDYHIYQSADFVEFNPIHDPKQSIILWNTSNPENNTDGRGRMDEYLTWKFTDLTQKYNGFYNFRNDNNRLMSRLHLTVKEHIRDMQVDVDERLSIVYPWLSHMTGMTFTPDIQDHIATRVKDGQVVNDYWFNDKLHLVANGIEVSRPESHDSGTFEFRDSEHNLIMTVHVGVITYHFLDIISYISYSLLFIASVSLCCCYCCVKKRYKGNMPVQETAAAPDANHYDQNRPAASSYSAAPSSSAVSYQPVNVPKANVPAAPSADPPAYDSINFDVNPTETEVAPPEKQTPAPIPPISSSVPSSDAEPTFDLKRATPSPGLFLSSDSTTSHVYNSDKLNFL